MCAERLGYFHHFIIDTNYITEEGESKNGKQFRIIEYTGPQWSASASAMVEDNDKSINDYRSLYKINYKWYEVSPVGKLQMKLIICHN